MWKVIGASVAALLALWLVITVVGLVIKGLFWLAVVGGVLLLGTAVIGWARKATRQLK